jgi:ketosteroid isomerase-like protein
MLNAHPDVRAVVSTGPHPNAELVRRFTDAQQRGDAAVLMELLANDVDWHVPGKNLLSRDYNGKAEVAGFWGRARELSRGTVRIKLIEALGGDEFGVALVRVFGEREGRSLGGQFQAFTYIASKTAKSRSSGLWSKIVMRLMCSGPDRRGGRGGSKRHCYADATLRPGSVTF